MSSLLWFLLFTCLSSILALASPSRSIWSRMLIGPFLSVVYLLDLAGQIQFIVPGFFVVGSLWLTTFRRRERFTLDQFKYAVGPIASAILLVCFVAFRPSLLEYPVDHINYWQRLIDASSTGSPDVLTCSLGGLTVYDATCTLWLKLSASSPVSEAWVVSGIFVRLVHFAELLLLSLTLIRFWMAQSVKPISATCMIVLVFAGTGYLYDAFVINHAFQGSIIAAALMVECASILCWIFSRLRELPRQSKSVLLLVGAWYLFSISYVLLALKLHGIFALLILIWALITPLVIALFGFVDRPKLKFPRLAQVLFLSASCSLFSFLFIVRRAHDVPIPPNFAGVVIRWSDYIGMNVELGSWAVSFLPRTSDTRPESLAVLSAVFSLIILVAIFTNIRPNSLFDIRADGHDLTSARISGYARLDFALFTSFYVISIIIAYAVPPFSNLFLKLNPEYSSHMRLMWGACMISPLPLLLFGNALRSIRIASIAAIVVVLLPIQFVPGQRKQLFFSKSRHFLIPTPVWADPSYLAAALIPELNRLQADQPDGRPLTVMADPLVRSALYPFGISTIPRSKLGSDRLVQLSQLTPHFHADNSLALDISIKGSGGRLSDVVIQQPARECFYSVYADMGAYDPCIAAHATSFAVNRWSPELLRRYGYNLITILDSPRLSIWQR